MMKRFLPICVIMTAALICPLSCDAAGEEGGGTDGPVVVAEKDVENLDRSMELFDKAYENYFDQSAGMAMSRKYNPYTGKRSGEKGSVWMYTSSIEAVNAILAALEQQKAKGNSDIYDRNFSKYTGVLSKLVSGLDYYRGTFKLVGFTQTRDWSVYAVNRASSANTANVAGIDNVYDDQMWLVRELIEAYRLTGTASYLEKAEYLAEYVIDGWDCTIKDGKERGGITWGPGYYSKHSCSNGPIVSPLVWLHEIYKGSQETVTYRYIDAENGFRRVSEEMNKSDYYLMFARKIYHWQVDNLMYTRDNVGSNDPKVIGLFADNLNGSSLNGIQTETIGGVVYRKPADLSDFCNPAYSYNTGSMISGAADLLRVTGDASYQSDIVSMTDKSFAYFASKNTKGQYAYNVSGFNNWFNGVLMRSWVDACKAYAGTEAPIASFQDNLDYAYENFLYEGMLPPSLLGGWNKDESKNEMEGMFAFTFAAEYAVLSRYQSEK